MTPATAPADTNAVTLDQLLSCLSRKDEVDGIMLLGTTGTDQLTPTSDYDLLLVLNTLPAPLRMVNTWVEERLTEVYCTIIAAVERLVADNATWPYGTEAGIVLIWLKEGRIVHDRSGRLTNACQNANDAPFPTMAGEREIHDAWRHIGYNVAQIKRYLASDDPVSQSTIDMRLLYSVADVNLHYFTVRRLPWRGEKPAVRYWLEHDPEYFGCFERFTAERDRRRKVELYEELATLAMAPVGPLWKRGETIVSIGAGFGSGDSRLPPGRDEDALAFWQGLATAPSR